jgi:hypothetical protein
MTTDIGVGVTTGTYAIDPARSWIRFTGLLDGGRSASGRPVRPAPPPGSAVCT